ncbi:MAG: ATP-binding protein [Anaerolineales bacterium]|nr:MAG: ATP-binding protein [Anaerolineales bacterium]
MSHSDTTNTTTTNTPNTTTTMPNLTDISRTPGLSAARQAASQAVEHIDNASSRITRGGTGITVPQQVSLGQAADTLLAAARAEQDETQIVHVVKHLPFYAACYAFSCIMRDDYGINFASAEQSLFGPIRPKQYTIPVRPGVTETVTLGKFKLRNMMVKTDSYFDDNGVCRLQVIITLPNINKPDAMVLCNLLDQAPNVWAGQHLIFDSNTAEPRIPEIVTTDYSWDKIALNTTERAACQHFLNHIDMHLTLAQDHAIPFKRGVLLWGAWGTGKTLAAAVFMQRAQEQGISVIYEKSWDKLLSTMHLARDFGPTLVFCEDIDLATSRTLTNLLDDAALKTAPISLVVTTNHPERLDPAITRSGRMDICIKFDLPDANTRRDILAVHGVDPSLYNDAIASATDGMTGADLAEVAKRAIVDSLHGMRPMTSDDILGAAGTMMRPPAYVPKPQITEQLAGVGAALLDEVVTDKLDSIYGKLEDTDNTVDRINATVDNIEDNVC